MKKFLTCLFVMLFVVGLTMSGLGCAENQQGAKDAKGPCCEKKADGKCPPTCPKAAAAKKDAGTAQPAPAPAPAPAPVKPPQPAPTGEKK